VPHHVGTQLFRGTPLVRSSFEASGKQLHRAEAKGVVERLLLEIPFEIGTSHLGEGPISGKRRVSSSGSLPISFGGCLWNTGKNVWEEQLDSVERVAQALSNKPMVARGGKSKKGRTI